MIEPSPGPLLAPYGSELRVNCTSSLDFVISGWFFFLATTSLASFCLQPGDRSVGDWQVLSSNNTTHLDMLLERGINVTSSVDCFSMLTLRASEANADLLYVECEAVNSSDSTSTISRGVNVTVYGE